MLSQADASDVWAGIKRLFHQSKKGTEIWVLGTHYQVKHVQTSEQGRLRKGKESR